MRNELSPILLIGSRSQIWVLIFSLVCPFWLVGVASAQERVYFGNLHSHSRYSDGTGTPRQAFVYARDVAKVDFLALTEHNHLKAMGQDGIGIAANNALYNGGPSSLIKTALSITQNGKFVALYGQEFSVIKIGNHANVFEIPNVITASNGRFDELATFLETNLDSAGQPAIMMFNHPKNTTTIQELEYGLDDFGGDQDVWLRTLGPHAALMQMINGPGQTTGVNLKSARPAESAFRKFLALGFRLAPTADQDNHTRNWGNATTARTAVIANSLTRSSILDALRKRHVYATEDRNLSIIIKINGRLCGDIVSPVPAASEASITYSIVDPDEPDAQYEIQVWRGTVGGDRAKMVSAVTVSGGTGTIEDIALSGAPEFFYFKIIQSDTDSDEDDQDDESWTAPVWFEQSSSFASLNGGAIVDSYVASRRSKIYHVSEDCLDAQRIKTSNRITGADARKGRTLHDDCPRRDQN